VTTTEQVAAEDQLRSTITTWLEAHHRGHAGEIPGDLVVIAHFRSWNEADEQVDDYEVIHPDGVSYHAALGLLQHGVDILASPDDDD
jgi:hypothetical protein